AQLELRSNAAWLTVPTQMRTGAPATDITVAYRPAALVASGVDVGTVTAPNPSDTLAGALFQLVNTIAVPYDLGARPMTDQRRAVANARRPGQRAAHRRGVGGSGGGAPPSRGVAHRARAGAGGPGGGRWRDAAGAVEPVHGFRSDGVRVSRA